MDCDCEAVSDMGNSDVSLLGSPSHICELGEGPFILNHAPSHYPDHLSYSILREDCQL